MRAVVVEEMRRGELEKGEVGEVRKVEKVRKGDLGERRGERKYGRWRFEHDYCLNRLRNSLL